MSPVGGSECATGYKQGEDGWEQIKTDESDARLAKDAKRADSTVHQLQRFSKEQGCKEATHTFHQHRRHALRKEEEETSMVEVSDDNGDGCSSATVLISPGN